MTRSEIVKLCLTDAAHGDYHPLLGLLDWLIHDCGVSLDRILVIAERRFGISKVVALNTLNELY